jgi:hypothetical protein
MVKGPTATVTINKQQTGTSGITLSASPLTAPTGTLIAFTVVDLVNGIGVAEALSLYQNPAAPQLIKAVGSTDSTGALDFTNTFNVAGSITVWVQNASGKKSNTIALTITAVGTTGISFDATTGTSITAGQSVSFSATELNNGVGVVGDTLTLYTNPSAPIVLGSAGVTGTGGVLNFSHTFATAGSFPVWVQNANGAASPVVTVVVAAPTAEETILNTTATASSCTYNIQNNSTNQVQLTLNATVIVKTTFSSGGHTYVAGTEVAYLATNRGTNPNELVTGTVPWLSPGSTTLQVVLPTGGTYTITLWCTDRTTGATISNTFLITLTV